MSIKVIKKIISSRLQEVQSYLEVLADDPTSVGEFEYYENLGFEQGLMFALEIIEEYHE